MIISYWFLIMFYLYCVLRVDGYTTPLFIPYEVTRVLYCSLLPLAGTIFPDLFWIVSGNASNTTGGFFYIVSGEHGRIDISFDIEKYMLSVSMRVGFIATGMPVAVSPLSNLINGAEVGCNFKVGDVICKRTNGELFVVTGMSTYYVPPKVPFTLHAVTRKRTVRVPNIRRVIMYVKSFLQVSDVVLEIQGDVNADYVKAAPLQVFGVVTDDGTLPSSVKSLSWSALEMQRALNASRVLKSIVSIICQNAAELWQERLFAVFMQYPAYYSSRELLETATFLQLLGDVSMPFLSRLTSTVNHFRPTNAVTIVDLEESLPAKRTPKRKLFLDV